MEGFHRWVQGKIARQREPAEEARSIFEGKDDSVEDDGEDKDNEDNEDEEEDKEEEEDPGYIDDSGDDEEDDDSPPASSHRPGTWSTPKKPVSRPKKKAYRTKGSRPGSSSWKRTKGSQ